MKAQAVSLDINPVRAGRGIGQAQANSSLITRCDLCARQTGEISGSGFMDGGNMFASTANTHENRQSFKKSLESQKITKSLQSTDFSCGPSK
jgi:hypothetical protein